MKLKDPATPYNSTRLSRKVIVK